MVPSARSGGTGADARPSASRTAGRTSAPPGRGQAAKAVFRRGRMARIRRMRGAPQAGRAARRQARTHPGTPERASANRAGLRPRSRRTGAERAGARSGRARSQSDDWRAARTRAKRPFPPGANGWGEVTRTFGWSARYDTAQHEVRATRHGTKLRGVRFPRVCSGKCPATCVRLRRWHRASTSADAWP